MDTSISINGDFDTDENENLFFIDGNDELKQKIYILLSASEGGFIYDRTLGSRISGIDTDSADACVLIEAEARRTLGQLDGVEVTGAEVRNGRIFVFVSNGENEFEVELRRNANE